MRAVPTLPLGALILTTLSGEPQQTVVVVTFFASLMAAMLRSSIH